jgi:hypothetical protein
VVAALHSLYRLGRTDVALPLIDKIRSRHGGELSEAVQVVSELMKDPRALPVLRERIAAESDPHDRREPAARAVDVRRRRVGGDVRRRLVCARAARRIRSSPSSGDRSPGGRLSAHAGLKMQTLGPPPRRALLDVLAGNPPRRWRCSRSTCCAASCAPDCRRARIPRSPPTSSRRCSASCNRRRATSPCVARPRRACRFFDDIALGSSLIAASRVCGIATSCDRSISCFWNYF